MRRLDRRTFLGRTAKAAAAAPLLVSLGRFAPAFAQERPFEMLVLGDSVMWGQGLKEEEKLSVILLVTSFTRSFATLNQDLTEAAGGEPTIANLMPRYGEMIRKLTSAAEFPALHAVVDAGTFDIEADLDDPDYDFRFGLERLLDGIEVLIRRRG